MAISTYLPSYSLDPGTPQDGFPPASSIWNPTFYFHPSIPKWEVGPLKPSTSLMLSCSSKFLSRPVFTPFPAQTKNFYFSLSNLSLLQPLLIPLHQTEQPHPGSPRTRHTAPHLRRESAGLWGGCGTGVPAVQMLDSRLHRTLGSPPIASCFWSTSEAPQAQCLLPGPPHPIALSWRPCLRPGIMFNSQTDRRTVTLILPGVGTVHLLCPRPATPALARLG